MTGKYILKDKAVVACDDLTMWAQWMETADRKVDENIMGDVRVSTVFLGLDYSFGGGSALLFETMIFGGPHDGYQRRYSTWNEAEHGHKAAVKIANED